MSIHAIIMASTARHALLLRDVAQTRKKRRSAAEVVSRHHGQALVAILGRGGCPDAVADGERLVQACARGAPTSGVIAAALARLGAILRRGRVTAPGHARAATHRARLAALHALTVRLEALESVLAVTQPTDMSSLKPLGAIEAQAAIGPA